jgi:hypothetical protein
MQYLQLGGMPCAPPLSSALALMLAQHPELLAGGLPGALALLGASKLHPAPGSLAQMLLAPSLLLPPCGLPALNPVRGPPAPPAALPAQSGAAVCNSNALDCPAARPPAAAAAPTRRTGRPSYRWRPG